MLPDSLANTAAASHKTQSDEKLLLCNVLLSSKDLWIFEKSPCTLACLCNPE